MPPSHYASRLVFAATALLVLAIAAAGAALYQRYASGRQPAFVSQPPFTDPAFVGQTIQLWAPAGDRRFEGVVGSAKQQPQVHTGILAGAAIPVAWKWEEAGHLNALRRPGSATVTLRAGTLAQPIRPCAKDWPLRSIAVIGAAYEKTDTRQLAIRLLDKGSADLVLAGENWEPDLTEALGPGAALNAQTQVLVFLPAAGNVEGTAATLAGTGTKGWSVAASKDFSALARQIDFSGALAVDQTFLKGLVARQSGVILVSGGAERTPADKDKNGIEWVTVCAGTFTMGRMDGERDGARDETPAHTVALKTFQIAATETTNEQYSKIGDTRSVTAVRADAMRPAVNVNWAAARSACEKAGGDLPTEAQWEYAARAGSRSRGSFGDDEKRLGAYAWLVAIPDSRLTLWGKSCLIRWGFMISTAMCTNGFVIGSILTRNRGKALWSILTARLPAALGGGLCAAVRSAIRPCSCAPRSGASSFPGTRSAASGSGVFASRPSIDAWGH